MLRQNHARARSRTIRAIVALADAVESVARRDDPRIVRRPLQIFPEIFKDRWIVRRHGRKIIKRLVSPGRETRRRNVVPENSAIHHLREKRRLRNHLAHHVRDVFLSLGRKRLLIARPAAKRDDDNLALLHRARRIRNRRRQQRTPQRNPRRRPNKVAPRQRKLPRQLERIGWASGSQVPR